MISNDTHKFGEIIIYKTPQNNVELKVKLDNETVWLSLDQISHLFNRDKSVISRHINNIFTEKELNRNSVVANYATTAIDGKTYNVDYYNLDAIISVGYRVNSQRATYFRVWATKVLKQYLVKGYIINEKLLLEAKNKFNELKEAVLFLQKQSKKELLHGQEAEILNLLADYSKTLTILNQYDKGELESQKGEKTKFVLKYKDCQNIISELRDKLIVEKEAGDFFGQEKNENLDGIINGLYQTFDRKELYPTIEDKASNLLYLIIKDHPLVDGNKRSAAFLFVYFLDKTNYLFKKSGERKINDNALVALTLLIAESNPKDKDVMIKIIKNLIAEYEK